MNQQSSNRKPGPDNNIPPTGEDPQKKKSRFNIYWVYGIFIVALITWNLYRGVGSTGVETDQQKFYEMAKQGDVERIKTIRNTKRVRIFIYKDSLIKKAAFYKNILNDKENPTKYESAVKANQPQLYFSFKEIQSYSKEL